MNIYVKMEILERELEGRLLLALVAAERGHDVLLGDFRSLLSHRLWLTPGVFHDKSITPKPAKIRLLRRLNDAGFVITSQDEEHGLSEDAYDAFARRRFSNETFALAGRVLTWGPHDTSALREHYPEHAGRLVATGSPRVDVWRRELAQLQAPDLPGVDAGRPYVLFSTSALPFQPNPFWTIMRDARPSQFPGPDDAREWVHYVKYAVAYAYVGRLVRAIRLAANELPDVQFVVRPHPTSVTRAWHDALGDVPENVRVIREGGSGRWIEHAAAVVHNGSTTGVESAARGVPTISFQPNGERHDMFANRIGRVAPDEASLVALITAAASGDGRAAWWSGHDPAPLLAQRFAALDGPLAADRIVDAWEEFDRPELRAPNRPGRARRLATAHRRAGSVRSALLARGSSTDGSPGLDLSSKFPPLDASRLARLVDAFRRTTGRFVSVDARLVSADLVHVTRSVG
jgi:surface carbohydrate biosynthesis protein